MGDQLKFLVGVGVGKKVEKWLIENGYDAKFVRDINPKPKIRRYYPLPLLKAGFTK